MNKQLQCYYTFKINNLFQCIQMKQYYLIILIYVFIIILKMTRGLRHGRRSYNPNAMRDVSPLLVSSSAYEQATDIMLSFSLPASLVNGIYTFIGKEASFKEQVDAGMAAISAVTNPQYSAPLLNLTQHDMMNAPNEQEINFCDNYQNQQQIPVGSGSFLSATAIQQGNITLYGIKTKPKNKICSALTFILGVIFIFPLFFWCCMWWKRIVFPTYELSHQAYNSVAKFIAKAPNMIKLDLSVVDNSFNAQKSRILYEALSHSQIREFNFTNRVLNCNGAENQADNFRQNMLQIKSLNMKTSVVWADMSF